jgi:hypothetical protein
MDKINRISMLLSSIRHTLRDCSLCKRLHGSTIEPNRERRRRRVERIDPSHLILPEETYYSHCIPWYDLPCGHSYHVPCLAVLNPAKYSNISYIKDGPDTINVDEVHCLDCSGRGINNCTFHATTDEPDVRMDDGKTYINIKDAFETAERDADQFIIRYNLCRERVNLKVLLGNYENSMDRKTIEEVLLPDIRNKLIDYLKLNSMLITDLSLDHEQVTISYLFTTDRSRYETDHVYWLDLTKPMQVTWDRDKLIEQRMLIDVLNIDNMPIAEHIERVNRLANPISRYLSGVYDDRLLIDDTNPIVAMMLYDTVDPQRRGLCVLNNMGVKKRILHFGDFPISENTGICGISGGRKTKKRHSI